MVHCQSCNFTHIMCREMDVLHTTKLYYRNSPFPLRAIWLATLPRLGSHMTWTMTWTTLMPHPHQTWVAASSSRQQACTIAVRLDHPRPFSSIKPCHSSLMKKLRVLEWHSNWMSVDCTRLALWNMYIFLLHPPPPMSMDHKSTLSSPLSLSLPLSLPISFQVAAERRLKEKQFSQALKLFELSRVSIHYCILNDTQRLVLCLKKRQR